MYTKIIEFLKTKPKEYAMSTSKFWDDPHISKYMLEAHLNPDMDSASRKHDFIKRSATWIADIAVCPDGKELLDLGCGPGLYATVFDDLGFHVTGIDFAERSIRYAKEQALHANKRISYLYQNYLEIEYENQFDVVTLIFCDYGVLKPSDRHLLVSNIKKALKPNGILILDGFTENQYKDFVEEKTVDYVNTGFWNETQYVCIRRNIPYDATKTYLEQYIIITDDSCNCYNIWNQEFNKETLTDELKCAGFTDIQYYGNVCGECFNENSKTICVVAK